MQRAHHPCHKTTLCFIHLILYQPHPCSTQNISSDLPALYSQVCLLCPTLPLSSKDPEHFFYLAVRLTMACSVGSSADHAPGFSLPQRDLVDSPTQNSWVLWTGPLHLPQGLTPLLSFYNFGRALTQGYGKSSVLNLALGGLASQPSPPPPPFTAFHPLDSITHVCNDLQPQGHR